MGNADQQPGGSTSGGYTTVDGLVGVSWVGGFHDGKLVLTDQTLLPGKVSTIEPKDLESLREAIISLRVRGAPAIGIAAAYGLAQHCRDVSVGYQASARGDEIETAFRFAVERLGSSRPTAVNLRWALNRCRDVFERHASLLTAQELAARLLMEARRIHREDRELCQRIADHGAALLPSVGGVLTHCNTGALATGGVGTALGCIRLAHLQGKKIHVYADETRPLLQGARLTALELQRAGVPVQVICDNMAGHLMQRGMVQAVIVGADRITTQGDTANKIGTYALAVLAKHHQIPFYVAAPYSTFDLKLNDGVAQIPIEERNPDEVRAPQGVLFAPADMPVVNPAFDVTPGSLITAIITERGVITPVNRANVLALMGDDKRRGDEPAV